MLGPRGTINWITMTILPDHVGLESYLVSIGGQVIPVF